MTEEVKTDAQHNLEAVNMLIKQIKPFIENPATDKTIQLEMYGSWAEVSTRTYESIYKSATMVAATDDQMQMTAIVMKANHRDAHNGYTTAETVTKACQSYNEMGNGAAGIQHALAVEVDTVQFIESFIAPKDFEIVAESGSTLVKAGDWVATAQFNNPFFWNMAKAGDLDSFSIEADGLITMDDVNV
jgi:hypothetical protein